MVTNAIEELLVNMEGNVIKWKKKKSSLKKAKKFLYNLRSQKTEWTVHYVYTNIIQSITKIAISFINKKKIINFSITSKKLVATCIFLWQMIFQLQLIRTDKCKLLILMYGGNIFIIFWHVEILMGLFWKQKLKTG